MNPSEIQNTEEALLLQSCARLYYNKATRLEGVFWLVNIALPILMILYPFNPLITLLIALSFVLSIYSDKLLQDWTEKGADMKLFFDKIVFNFQYSDHIKNELIFDAEKNKRINETNFSAQMGNDGDLGGVKSWYSNLDNNLTIESQYKESQVETSDYDVKIRRLILGIFCLISITCMGLIMIKDLTVNEMLTLLFLTFATLTRKMIQTGIELKKEKELLDKIDSYLCINNISKEKSLELLALEDKKRRVLLPLKGLAYPLLHIKIKKTWSSK